MFHDDALYKFTIDIDIDIDCCLGDSEGFHHVKSTDTSIPISLLLGTNLTRSNCGKNVAVKY